MTWFPMFVKLENKRCLIAGGGQVAFRKAEALLCYHPHILAVSPSFLPAFDSLPIERCKRPVCCQDAVGMDLVIDATGDATTGQMLSHFCAEQKIPLNVVDRPELCTMIFPAVLQRGSMVAAISTGGASPAAASWARDRLDASLPEALEEILDQMQSLRETAKARLPQSGQRRDFLKACFNQAVQKGVPLSSRELEDVWEEFL